MSRETSKQQRFQAERDRDRRLMADHEYRHAMCDELDRLYGTKYVKPTAPPPPITAFTGKRRVTISAYDQIQAIRRHPEFRKELDAWTDLFQREHQPGYRPTEADKRRNWGKRSHWSSKAEMEASRYQALSRQEDHQRWLQGDGPVTEAWRMLDAKLNGDTITVYLPVEQPVSRTLQMVESLLKCYRDAKGIEETQPLKPTSINPWWVYDEHVGTREKKGRSLLAIAQELTGITANPNYNPKVKLVYNQVRRAYQQAQRMMRMIEP